MDGLECGNAWRHKLDNISLFGIKRIQLVNFQVVDSYVVDS